MPKPTVTWTGATICDFCGKDARQVGKTFIDGQTRYGPWALMCNSCYILEGINKLGPGYGQAYDSKTREKVAG